jgi:hypothetical protein
MDEFQITAKGRTETFRIGNDYGPGEIRQHWTLSGLEKLIRLGLWKREIDKRGRVKAKPPGPSAYAEIATWKSAHSGWQ